jgi:hypothetical protein
LTDGPLANGSLPGLPGACERGSTPRAFNRSVNYCAYWVARLVLALEEQDSIGISFLLDGGWRGLVGRRRET